MTQSQKKIKTMINSTILKKYLHGEKCHEQSQMTNWEEIFEYTAERAHFLNENNLQKSRQITINLVEKQAKDMKIDFMEKNADDKTYKRCSTSVIQREIQMKPILKTTTTLKLFSPKSVVI